MTTKSKGRAVAIVVSIVGGLMPLRPLLFTKPSDPTIETIDLFFTPPFLLGQLVPPMALSQEFMLCSALVMNAVLYGFVAWFLWKWVTSEP